MDDIEMAVADALIKAQEKEIATLKLQNDDLLNKVEGAKDELVRMFPEIYLEDPANRGTIAVMLWKILTEKPRTEKRFDPCCHLWVAHGTDHSADCKKNRT